MTASAPQSAQFDEALRQYIFETIAIERRGRARRIVRGFALLSAALLVCQLPYARSGAANGLAPPGTETTKGVAAFTCPALQMFVSHRGAEQRGMRTV